jgi:type IV pilus assembly protein PilB
MAARIAENDRPRQATSCAMPILSETQRVSEPCSPQIALLETRQHLVDYLTAYADGDPNRVSTLRRVDLAGARERLGEDAEEAFALASELGLPLLQLEAIEATSEALQMVPAASARRLRAVPLLSLRGCVAVAIEGAADAAAMEALDFVSRQRVVPVLATGAALSSAIARFYDNAEDSEVARQLGIDPSGAGSGPSQLDMERMAREVPVVKLIHGIIAQAVYRRASDIHFRPGAKQFELLYRIDDDMVPVRSFLRTLAPALVSRIKVLAAMNLAEHRKPQDGRCTFVLDDGTRVDLRISILPSVFGESVVVRLLDTRESLKTLDEIGLTGADRERIDDLMTRSHGMFLTTGPTGCGKSTTLYAMLLEMRRQRINILTIEDPVEFHIEGVQQMQVNRAADFSFASALRNFLRHDPDTIMVGEIRDKETADIAVESALTGHLLLSTLHTNTAATTVTRLLDLGVEAFLLRVSLLAVMAQRLVRLTCEHCKAPETVAPHIRELLGVAPEEVFYSGRGCSNCGGRGVFRRSAVYELLVVTPALRRLIVPGAEADHIHEQALADGMVPITQAALAMARSGRISLLEAYRVRAD